MISRFRWPARLALFTLAVVPMVACERVPLLAPSGSSITLTTSTTALPVNGTTQIIAQVIEASGTPPHSGTYVTFTTTLGTIQPSPAQTDINGQAVVLFNAGSASGTASISAISGGSSVAAANALKILVGTAAVGRVVLNANPSLVPALGGSSTVNAQVYDVNGNGLSAAPVSFSTTAGTLSSTLAVTDRNGMAQVVLTTSTQAVVTASVGATGTSGGGGGGGGGATPPPATGTASASVTIGVAGAPTLVITPPTVTPSAGLPAVFTFVVTAAATNPTPVKDVSVEWGDGNIQSLGAITGTSTQSHVYAQAKPSYIIRATLTDAFGNQITVTSSVTVIQPAPATIIITPSVPTTPASIVQVGFTIQVTLPSGINVVDATISFGDGTASDLGSISTATITHGYSQKGPATVTVTVTDTLGRTTSGLTNIIVP